MTTTQYFDFVGQNIRGTPPMKADFVEHDLKVLMERADVVAVQEFRWDWYWTTLGKQAKPKVNARGERLDAGWAASPTIKTGTKEPVRAAQPIIWDRDKWAREASRYRKIHDGEPGISEDRFIRAVLLRDRETGLKCWFVSTHYVVGGDEAGDGPKRQQMLDQDIRRTDAFLKGLAKTGHPVIAQLDANIHKTSQTYPAFMAMLKRHDAKVHGVHGIEFLFTIDGKDARVEVKKTWQISTDDLKTDHEGRAITARLVSR
jgi:hypothetical protein